MKLQRFSLIIKIVVALPSAGTRTDGSKGIEHKTAAAKTTPLNLCSHPKHWQGKQKASFT